MDLLEKLNKSTPSNIKDSKNEEIAQEKLDIKQSIYKEDSEWMKEIREQEKLDKKKVFKIR